MTLIEFAEDVVLKVKRSPDTNKEVSQLTGIKHATLWRILNKKRPMTIPELNALSQYLKLDIKEVFNGKTI